MLLSEVQSKRFPERERERESESERDRERERDEGGATKKDNKNKYIIK